jgi:multidrug efflux pump subunit AcrB
MSLIIALIIFIASLWMIPIVGVSLFPASEKPQFMIDISTPSQSNIAYTDTIAQQIESKLKQMPQVKYFSTNVGKGNPRIYYNVQQRNEQPDFSQIFVQLQPNTNPSEKLAIIDTLRALWTPYLTEVKVVNFEQGIPQLAPIEVRLIGDNLDTLQALASKTESLLSKVKGAIYVNNPIKTEKTDIRIKINKEKLPSA